MTADGVRRRSYSWGRASVAEILRITDNGRGRERLLLPAMGSLIWSKITAHDADEKKARFGRRWWHQQDYIHIGLPVLNVTYIGLGVSLHRRSQRELWGPKGEWKNFHNRFNCESGTMHEVLCLIMWIWLNVSQKCQKYQICRHQICVFKAPNAPKPIFGQDFAPDPAGAVYDASQTPSVAWGGGRLIPIASPWSLDLGS